MKPRLPIRAYVNILSVNVCYQAAVGRISRYRQSSLQTSHTFPFQGAIMVFLLFWGFPINGTAIVAIRTSNRVVVSADRKIAATVLHPERTRCKIEQGSGFFFAYTGNIFRFNGFDPSVIISQTQVSGSITQKADILIQRIKESYLALWKGLKKQNEGQYNQASKLFGIVFFGLEANMPIIVEYQFIPAASFPSDVEIQPYKCPGDCLNGLAIEPVANNKAILRFVDANPHYVETTDVVEVARHFIELEIADLPKDVGPPIDIISVSKDGACWEQHEDREGPNIPKCPPIPAQPPPRAKPSGDPPPTVVAVIVLALLIGTGLYFALRRR